MFVKTGIDSKDIKKFEIVAHRGGAGIGIENTLTCIEKGIQSGADAIEIDVHMTKDGHLIISHDQTVNRMTNGSGKIREMTFSEIRELRVVDSNGNITEEFLPTLKEVLSLINARTKLIIEVKKTDDIYKGIEGKILNELNSMDASSWSIIQSFNDSVLEKVNELSPSQRLEKLFFHKLFGLPYIFDGKITRFSFEKYHYISSFNIYHRGASRGLINKIHEEGKEVKIWTLDGPKKTLNLEIDGVITDRPDLWNE